MSPEGAVGAIGGKGATKKENLSGARSQLQLLLEGCPTAGTVAGGGNARRRTPCRDGAQPTGAAAPVA